MRGVPEKDAEKVQAQLRNDQVSFFPGSWGAQKKQIIGWVS